MDTLASDFVLDIEPVFTKNLLITINDDSTVPSVEVKEWKK